MNIRYAAARRFPGTSAQLAVVSVVRKTVKKIGRLWHVASCCGVWHFATPTEMLLQPHNTHRATGNQRFRIASIFAAQMKSFSLSPPTECVLYLTVQTL